MLDNVNQTVKVSRRETEIFLDSYMSGWGLRVSKDSLDFTRVIDWSNLLKDMAEIFNLVLYKFLDIYAILWILTRLTDNNSLAR